MGNVCAVRSLIQWGEFEFPAEGSSHYPKEHEPVKDETGPLWLVHPEQSSKPIAECKHCGSAYAYTEAP